jgi:hypothetical protein
MSSRKDKAEMLGFQVETAAAFQRLFKSADGERVMDHLKFRFHHNGTTVDDNIHQVDFGRLAFNEGQRSVILYISGIVGMRLDDLKAEAKALQAEPKDDIGV